MSETFIPYLCGGTFFTLLLDARKPTISRRERTKGKSDVIHEQDILKALIRFVHPSVPIEASSSFKTYTSRFKNCKGDIGEELKFKDPAIKENFKKRMKEKYPMLRKEAVEFCIKYIDEEKNVQLVKQMIELIRDDNSIKENIYFQVDEKGKKVPKSELPKIKDFSLPNFLLSVWFFIVTEHNDNGKGRDTVEKWDNRNKEGTFSIEGKSICNNIDVSCIPGDIPGNNEEKIDILDNREGTTELKQDVIFEKDGKSVPGLFVLNKIILETYKKRMDSLIVMRYRRISAKMEYILCAVCSGATKECVLENKKATLVDVIQKEIMQERQAIFLLGNGGIGKTTTLVQTAVRISKTGKEVYLFRFGEENDLQIKDEIVNRVVRSAELEKEQKYVLFIDSPCNNSDVLKALLNKVQYNENVQVVISEKLNRFDLIMEDVIPELYFSTAEIILPVLDYSNFRVSKFDGNRILKFKISSDWKRQIILDMFKSIPGIDISKIESIVKIESKMSIVEAYIKTCIQYNKLVDEENIIATACKVRLDWDEWDALVNQFEPCLEPYEAKQLTSLFSIVAALDIFKVKTRISLLAKKMGIEGTRLDNILRSMISSGNSEPLIYENECNDPYVKLKHDVVSELYFTVKERNPQLVLEEIITVFDEKTVIDFEKRVFKRKYVQSGHEVPFHINTKKLYKIFQEQTIYYNILENAHRSYSFDIAGIWMQEILDKQAVTNQWENLLTDYLSRTESPMIKRKVLACCKDDCERRSIPFPRTLREQEKRYENPLQAAVNKHDVRAIAEEWAKELQKIYQTNQDKKRLMYEWRKIIFDYLVYGFDMPDEFMEVLDYENYQVVDACYFNIRIYVKRNRLNRDRYFRLGITLYKEIADRQREDVQSRMHLAYCYEQCNEMNQAEAVYVNLMKIQADFRQYSAFGSFCARRLKDEWKLLEDNIPEKKRLEETCETCFRCAIEGAERDKDKGVSYGALGWFLFRTKTHFEESYKVYQKALEHYDQATTHGQLGMLCCFYNKRNTCFSIEEAAYHFEKAIHLSPAGSLDRLFFYIPYANMRYCIGEYDEAVSLYLKAAKLGEKKADEMLERIRRERKVLDTLKERPLQSIMTLQEAHELTYGDKSVFGDEKKRKDIFTLLLNFVSNNEKTLEDVKLAVFITINLSRSEYGVEPDPVKYRIIQQVELLAIEYDINREMAERNFRAQCFFISKLLKSDFSYEFKLMDYEMI